MLLHGLGRTAASMLPLGWRLERAGFRVAREGYSSTRQGIAASVAEVRRALERLDGVLDIVGHSLGGLIAAAILRTPGGLGVGRIVQIGSPNLGSPLVDRVGGLWPVRQVCGPAMEELTARDGRLPPDPRIGAIAGTLGWPAPGLARPHDGSVTVRSAWSGAGHRAAVPALHTALPASSRVARLVAAFLQTGRFPEER